MTEMAEIEAKKYDVFLVHSSDDKDVAIKIKAGLHAKELEVYAHFDEGSSFGIGKPTVNSIMEAVNLSQTVLILLTQNAIKVLSCQPRVTMTSCFVYKVIRDLESIDHLCINPIHK